MPFGRNEKDQICIGFRPSLFLFVRLGSLVACGDGRSQAGGDHASAHGSAPWFGVLHRFQSILGCVESLSPSLYLFCFSFPFPVSMVCVSTSAFWFVPDDLEYRRGYCVGISALHIGLGHGGDDPDPSGTLDGWNWCKSRVFPSKLDLVQFISSKFFPFCVLLHFDNWSVSFPLICCNLRRKIGKSYRNGHRNYLKMTYEGKKIYSYCLLSVLGNLDLVSIDFLMRAPKHW